jgi:hypothetical protein
MPDKKPTPFTLIVCTDGVNHSLQYRNSATARDAFRAANRAYADKSPLALEDDYGANVVVAAGGLRSFRLTDLVQEHRANMSLKLCELYAALEFEELVKSEHAALTLIKARNSSGGIIRPQ